MATLDYFKIATDICRKDAERIRRGEPLVPVGYVPSALAVRCGDCEAIFPVGPSCPNCASPHFAPVDPPCPRDIFAGIRLGDRPRRYVPDGSGYEILDDQEVA